jgi:hypothetical protein
MLQYMNQVLPAVQQDFDPVVLHYKHQVHAEIRSVTSRYRYTNTQRAGNGSIQECKNHVETNPIRIRHRGLPGRRRTKAQPSRPSEGAMSSPPPQIDHSATTRTLVFDGYVPSTNNNNTNISTDHNNYRVE